ncbi:hypothetical protein L7F22_003886 [Adiantum nelumboides]|nr:hypothetical protein [Adiantum nelumboides]
MGSPCSSNWLHFVRRSLSSWPTAEHLATSPLDVYKTLRLNPYLLSSITASSFTSSAANLGVKAMLSPGGTSSGSVNKQGPDMLGSSGSSGIKRSLLYARTDPVLGSVLQLAGTAHLLRAASWELYGSAPMARVSALIHAMCYGDVASADDSSLAYVKLAQYLAAHKSYKEACAALDIATKKFPLAAKSRLRATRLQIIHERALHRGDIKTAQAACDSLSALLSPVQGVDIEHKIDVARRHAQTLLRAGQFAEAASAAHSLFNTCYENKMQLESIMTLLLLAEIHKKAGSFVSGLPYALASLTLSKTFNLDLVHALAIVTLAELWLGLGPTHAQRALALLQQCMTLVLGHGGRDLRARTYIAVARCHLSNPAYSVHANPQAVCEPLQAAAEELEALEDNELASEVYYLQARVFHALGAVQERDHAASLFQKFTLALRDAQTVETPSLP